ncbi:MAG TPA: hypothetical protein VKQ54_09360, partial [Caulobacteraceae bacterium]|nr:hypothetical protein [Caulobacteraceae bacterium]
MRLPSIAVCLVLVATRALAVPGVTARYEDQIEDLASRWARVNFEIQDKGARALAAARLAGQADAL